uniref:Uncharacterized protein n=1 Tax=Florenciella parvula TaxID=236787 RepID=A0A7S2CPH4_9STRA
MASMLRESRESPWAETGSGSSVSGASAEEEDFDESFASGFTQSTLSVQRAPRDYQDEVYEVKQEFSSANAAAALALETSAPADADQLPYGYVSDISGLRQSAVRVAVARNEAGLPPQWEDPNARRPNSSSSVG